MFMISTVLCCVALVIVILDCLSCANLTSSQPKLPTPISTLWLRTWMAPKYHIDQIWLNMSIEYSVPFKTKVNDISIFMMPKTPTKHVKSAVDPHVTNPISHLQQPQISCFNGVVLLGKSPRATNDFPWNMGFSCKVSHHPILWSIKYLVDKIW